MAEAYHNEYAHKRRETVEAGLQLIEIDYLHASKPVIKGLPSYPNKENNAHPYIVLVSDPRPNLVSGETIYFAWHVDNSMPNFTVNLLGNDRIVIELGQIYNRTFESIRYYHQRVIDYEELPINFDTYTEADQQKIQAMLKTDIREQLKSDIYYDFSKSINDSKRINSIEKSSGKIDHCILKATIDIADMFWFYGQVSS